MNNKELAEKIVKLVIADLRDRSGIGNSFDDIDRSTMKEIIETNTEQVAEELDAQRPGEIMDNEAK